MARLAEGRGDGRTNDLIVSDLIRTNQMQTWMPSEHVVETSLTHPE